VRRTEREKAASRFRYLMLGYGLIWLTLGAFLLNLNRRIAQVGKEVEDLTGRLEDARSFSRGKPR
jgi:CcmD family protein